VVYLCIGCDYMAVTGKQVFDITMNLIHEVSETGSIALDSPAYYETRSKAILSILQSELLPITETPQILTSLDTELVIDDRLAIQVLPYGLAAHLLMQEDMSIAA